MTTTREDPMGQAATEAAEQKKVTAAKASGDTDKSSTPETIAKAKAAAGAPTPAQGAAATPDSETNAMLAQIIAGQKELENRLAAAEARAEAAEEERDAALATGEPPPATGDSALLERLTDLIEKMGEGGGSAVPGRTFKDGETASDVVRSLEGTVNGEDPDDDRLDRPVTFIAKGSNYCCVRKARHRFTTANGEAQVTTGITLDFAPGGIFVTDSKQNADWLRSRPGFNKEFWEQGKEPNAAPSATPVIERIMEATVNFDDAELLKLRAEEVAGPNRGDVVTMIDSALARIQNPED